MKFRVIFFLMIPFVLVACGEKIETNMEEKMVDFEFMTQDQEMLGLDDLKEGWWIANFMYTNCRTVCPRTTANLVEVQEKLSEDGLSPRIVSFSVEPSYDQPDVLKEYAEGYGADLENWSFLTGYDFETIKEISEGTFRTVLEKGAIGQRSHGYNFFLVNPDGVIVKKYDGMSAESVELLADDLRTVL